MKDMTELGRPDLSRAFDSIGARYGDAFPERPGQIAAGEWLVDRLSGLGYQPTVLDVGCGTGRPTAEQLTAAGATVVGIDTSPVMLDLARENVPDAIFVERDLNDLDGLHAPGHRFDAATAFFSLLVLHRADVGPALDAIRHVLKPGGLFALGMVEGDSDYLLREFLGTQVPLTAYPREQLVELLAEHGFTVLELTAEQWTPSTPDAPTQTHLYARCLVHPD